MKKIIIILLIVCFIPFTNIKAIEKDITPNAQSAILIEANSRQVLYEKNGTKKMYPASTTKIMTMILMFEAIRDNQIAFDDVVTTSNYAASMGGSQIYLEPGESLTLKDMFKSIAIASANDASVAVAEHIAGNIDKFVEMMNTKAHTLNLKNTHFKNATGLHDLEHYSCAMDLATMAAYLIDIGGKDLLAVTSLYDSYIREDSKKSFWLVNTNKLLKLYDGVDGLKTGYTRDAGYCLVTTVKRNNQRLIGVLMKEEAPKVRNEEMVNLLDYGYNNYKQITIFKKDDVIEKHLVDKMNNLFIEAKCNNDIVYTKAKNDNSKISTKITYANIQLPIKQGDIIGKLDVIKNNKIIASYDIYSSNDIKAVTYFSKFVKTFKNMFNGLSF